MISITTGRRLHFGLFTPVPMPELNLAYGGVGVMVDVPGISLVAEPSDSWSSEGPQANRVLKILERLQTQSVPPPHTIKVTYAAPAHQGWGTGTQLALAVSRLWYHLSKRPWSAQEAAHLVGRGLRSSVGIAGFVHAGLIFDEGKRCNEPWTRTESVVRRVRLPQEWTWLLVEPRGEMGLHSEEELAAFAQLPRPNLECVRRARELGEAAFNAASQRQFSQFADFLTEYNRLAGSFYDSIQGGAYGSRITTERIAHVQSLGVRGVGQSSWGPGIFAVFPNEAAGEEVKSRLELPNCSLYLGRTSCTSPRVDSSPEAR